MTPFVSTRKVRHYLKQTHRKRCVVWLTALLLFAVPLFHATVSRLNINKDVRKFISTAVPFPARPRQSTAGLCDRPDAQNLRFCILQQLLRRNQSVVNRLREKKNHYIATCTPVKHAGDLIHEFVVRNYLAGVDHFYIYDNNDGNTFDKSFDKIPRLLEPFAPLVTFVQQPTYDAFLKLVNRSGTIRAKSFPHHMLNWHCFLKYGSSAKWMISIDTDEFLEAKRPYELDNYDIGFEHVPFMQVFLAKIEGRLPAQIGRWNTVLTNGVIEAPSLEKVTLHDKYPIACGRRDIAPNPMLFNYIFASKVAVQPRYVDYEHHREIGDFFLHGVKHWWSNKVVVKELYFSEPYKNYTIPFNSLDSEWEVVHYWSRSLADYMLKRNRGRLNQNNKVSIADLITREVVCKEHNSYETQPSTERRNYIVREILLEIDRFREIQKIYYRAAMDNLLESSQQYWIRQYKKVWEKSAGPST